MRFTIMIFIMVFTIGCKKNETVSVNQMDPEKLKRDILDSGSTSSFDLLSMYYGDKIMDQDFLNLSVLMYEKYNYSKALSNIYYAYIYKYNSGTPFLNGNLTELFKKVPKKEQEIALNYLKIGVEKGDFQCIERLSEYYLSVGEENKSKELLRLQEKLVKIHNMKVKDSLKKK